MDKDNLLRRAYRLLDGEHQITSVEVGEALPTNERFHTDSCDVCDLLREIDESLKPVGFVCDCHPAEDGGLWSLNEMCVRCEGCNLCTKKCCSECWTEGVSPAIIHHCKCVDHSCNPFTD